MNTATVYYTRKSRPLVQLEMAADNGHFLSEYDNGLIVFKPLSSWKVIKNKLTGKRYSSASGAGIRVVGRRIAFDKKIKVIRLKGFWLFFFALYDSILHRPTISFQIECFDEK